MSSISEATLETLGRISETLRLRASQCTSLESAGQVFADLLFSEFRESLVLARVFAALEARALPSRIRRFAEELAASRGASVEESTLILSLLGTRGMETPWNNRRLSREHLGIPLVSAEFIDGIPMIARLLKELGVRLDWFDPGDSRMVSQPMGGSSGLFFVEDATSAVDRWNRPIITNREFVENYKVVTVFGFGGSYMLSNAFIAAILFTTEPVPLSQAKRFLPLSSIFKSVTTSMIRRAALFTPDVELPA